MSDEEEYEDVVEEGEDGEDGEEGEEKGEGEDGEESAVKRSEMITKDIALIQDIFHYIDRTKNRISQQLVLDHRVKELERREAHRVSDDAGPGNVNGDVDDESLHWSEYEDLDEAQRAQLLEKAIIVLGGEEGRGMKTRK
jgi:hypothetical protein